MKNYRQDGTNVTLTAPTGGFTGGNIYVLGGMACVAVGTAAAGERAAVIRGCEVTYPKATGTALVQGADAYLHIANNEIVAASGAGIKRVGFVKDSVDAAATEVIVILATGKIA